MKLRVDFGGKLRFRQGLIFFSKVSRILEKLYKIYMKSTNSRFKKFWMPKPTSLLSVGSPDILEIDNKPDQWFPIAISLLSRQSCQPKSLKLFGPQSEACVLKIASHFPALKTESRRLATDCENPSVGPYHA